MFLFRIMRWVVYIVLIFIILLATIKLYEKHKAKNTLADFDQENVVALTFDDGPVPATRDVIVMLNELGIKATFFVLGDETSRRPELVTFAYESGHTVASHSWNHPHVLGFRSKDYIEYQLFKAEDTIKQATGVIPRFFRAPFGETSPWLNFILREKNQIGVHWTLSLRDWRDDSPKESIAEMFENIDKSEIVLLHDRAYADPEKLAILRQSILNLQARGFTFVTIDELYR